MRANFQNRLQNYAFLTEKPKKIRKKCIFALEFLQILANMHFCYDKYAD